MEVINDYSVDKNNYSKYANVKSILKYGERKDDNYDISFVIPTFKKPYKLREALESVMNQDRAGFKVEIIIVDNDWFNLDKTYTEKTLIKYSSNEVSYYQNEKNIGMFGNWNRCLELAKADWVAMLHDDDLLSPDYFRIIGKILNRVEKDEKLVLVKSNISVMHDGVIVKRRGLSRIIHQICKSKFLKFKSIDYDILGPDKIGYFGAPSCGTLMRREPYLRYGGFDETHFPSADVYYPERLVTHHGYKVALTMGELGFVRFEDNTSLKEETILSWAKEFIVYQDYYRCRSRFAGWLFKHFKNEMGISQRRYYDNCLMQSNFIVDKQRTRHELYQIMNYRQNKIKDMLYNKLWWLTYYRFKQLVALVTT